MKRVKSAVSASARDIKTQFVPSWGVLRSESIHQDSLAKSIQITNMYALILTVCGISVSVFLLYLKITVLGLLALPITGIFFSVIALNTFNYHHFSRVLLMLNFNVAVYAYATSMGRGSDTHFWFVTAAILAFAIFNSNERRLLFTSVATSCFLLVFALATDFHYNILPIFLTDDITLKIVSCFMTSLAVCTSLSVVYYVFSEYEKSVEKIRDNSQQEIQHHMAALNASNIVAQMNTEGKITYVNSTFCKTSGYSQAELMGQTHALLRADYHPEGFYRKIWTVVRSGKVWKGEILNRAKNGSYFWADTTIVPHLGESGETQGYTLISYDITATKTSELRFRSLFDHGSSGIVFAGLDGLITECNERYARFYGLSREEMIGKSSADLIDPEELEAQMIEVRSLLNGDTDFLIAERKIVRPDGSTIWCLMNASRIVDAGGKAVYIAGVLQEITQTKQLQSNLANSSAMAALGEMSAGVAHEINNPLAIIQGTANQLLLTHRAQKLSPEILTQKLEKIVSTSDRIAKIIRGMRSFSRDAEKDPFQPVELKLMVENVLSFCLERFKTHDVTIEMGEIPPIWIECRTVQIEQVLLNLLNNAHDAISGLPKKWIRMDFKQNADRLAISITDSGAGISAEVAKKIMQPFFTTKEVGKGTGLGLSISKGIVEKHGGLLKYDSSSANTCFVIDLPLKQENRVSEAA